MNRFTGKSVIVTGAGQGIGLEICRKLVHEGAFVLLNDISEKLAEEAAIGCMNGSVKGQCMAFAGDASDLKVIEGMTNKILRKTGELNMVVANAGITLFGDFLSYPDKDFDLVMNTNLKSAFFLAQEAANKMKEQKNGGSILLMSSVTGQQSHRNLAAYSMTKAALNALARNLVTELSPFQIRINSLAPGATLTERTQLDQNYEDTWSRLTPLGKPAVVEQVADAALFLLSDQASHITGQTLIIDGGWSVTSPQPEK